MIGRSLARFGQQKPIVIDADGVVVAGNGTMQAARALGWSRIAAVRSELSGPERVAFALADNRSAELAQWDDVDLAFLLGDLSREDQLVAGFNDADIARLMKDAAAERPAAAEPREPRVKPLKLDAEQRRVVEEVAAAVRDQHGRPDMPEAQAVVVALLEWISSGR